MISIIVAVHNQIEHSKLFLRSLQSYTHNPYELIVVDNNSTDGSGHLFEAAGSRVIRNRKNLCYACSQNQGTEVARYDYLAFLNNDLYLSPGWDRDLLEALSMYDLWVVSPCGIETMETRRATRAASRRWRWIGRHLHARSDEKGLRRLVRLMYGDWESFCRKRRERFHPQVRDGILGSCILARRSLFEKIEGWDPEVEASDWDLYLRVRRREESTGDVVGPKLVLWSYVHHFIRATADRRPPLDCEHRRMRLEEKWRREEIERLWYY